MKKAPLIAFLFLTAIVWSSGIGRYLDGPPRGVHQWRQTDAASLILRYYETQTPLLQPLEHNQTGQGGHTLSEFPLLYYFSAQWYRLLGPHESIPRILNLSITLLGLWCLFLCGRLSGLSVPAALVAPLLLATSPAYVYYGTHFLPNVPAISFAFAGLYAFLKYFNQYHIKWLLLGCCCHLLAMGLKISDGILFFSLVPVCFYQRKNIGRPVPIWWMSIGIGLVLAGTAAWIGYVRYYNTLYHNPLSLTGILPFWQMNEVRLADIWQRFYTTWSLHFFHPLVWCLHGVAALGFMVYYQRIQPLWRRLTLWSFAGSLLYLCLWTEPLYHHDYYYLSALVFLPVMWMGFLSAKPLAGIWGVYKATHYISYFLAGVVLTVLLWYNRGMQHHRSTDPIYENVAAGFYQITPYLRQLGVQPNDLVISAGDPTRNVSLYLMQQRGWTDVYNKNKISQAQMEQQGARYILLSGTPTKQNATLNLEHYTPIGNYEGITIYRRNLSE